MRTVRFLISLAVQLVVVIVALAATGGWWIDQAARTAEPSETIVAPIATNPQVVSAVATELESRVVAQLPESIDALPGARAQVENLISTSVAAVLANPAIDQAWRESLGGTRTLLVDDLDRYRTDRSSTPTVSLDLRPFMDLVRSRVLDTVPQRVRPLLEQVQWSNDGRVAVATLDARQAQVAAETLGLSQHWAIGYVVAGVLALVGLALGGRRGRWVAWVIASLVGLAGVLLARSALNSVEIADATSISGAVAGAAGQGIKASLLAWTAPLPLVFVGSAAIGLVALAVCALVVPTGRHRRRGA